MSDAARRRAALVLIDIMPIVVPGMTGDEALLHRLARAAAAARNRSVPVIHVRIMFRPGHPEISPNNRVLEAVTARFDFTESSPQVEIHPIVGAEPTDILVTKRRTGAFSGSDLELVLRSSGIDTLVLAGVSTSGCVLSTVRHAADLDYRLVVLSDGCFDRDAEVQRVLMEKIFPGQASVVSVDDWIASLTTAA
jgi:nicotinamidase-related amidase